MSRLSNPRHEAFAQARAAGAGCRAAYRIAGFTSASGHASRLDRSAPVAARVAELRADRQSVEALTGPETTRHHLRRLESLYRQGRPDAAREGRVILDRLLRLRADSDADLARAFKGPDARTRGVSPAPLRAPSALPLAPLPAPSAHPENPASHAHEDMDFKTALSIMNGFARELGLEPPPSLR